MDKLFSNYEVKLSGQMVKSLGKLIIRMYLMGACATLGMSNQNVLSEYQESDLFLNSTLQRFTRLATSLLLDTHQVSTHIMKLLWLLS